VRYSIYFLNFCLLRELRRKIALKLFPKIFLRLKDSNLKKKRKLSELVLNSSWIQSRGNLAYENSSLKKWRVCFHKSALSNFKSWISGYYLLANDLLELFKCNCLLDFQEQNLKRSRQFFCGNEESRWKMNLKLFQKPCPRCTLLAKRGVLKISIN